MNRYTAAGVLADMRAGKRVLVLSESTTMVHAAFHDLAVQRHADEPCTRSNGRERIVAADGPGEIRFRSIRSNLHGHTADVVVIDADANVHWATVEEIWRTVAATGELIRPL